MGGARAKNDSREKQERREERSRKGGENRQGGFRSVTEQHKHSIVSHTTHMSSLSDYVYSIHTQLYTRTHTYGEKGIFYSNKCSMKVLFILINAL